MSEPIERLENALRRLGEDQQPPSGWQDRVNAAIRAQPQPRPESRRRWWWLAVPALAAAAVLLVFWLRPPKPFELDVAFESPATEVHRGTSAKTGDTLHASAVGTATQRALWIYHDDRLVIACPGGTTCHTDGDTLIADYKLEVAGTFEIIALTSDHAIPSPSGTLDSDVASALQAGAKDHRQTVVVR